MIDHGIAELDGQRLTTQFRAWWLLIDHSIVGLGGQWLTMVLLSWVDNDWPWYCRAGWTMIDHGIVELGRQWFSMIMSRWMDSDWLWYYEAGWHDLWVALPWDMVLIVHTHSSLHSLYLMLQLSQKTNQLTCYQVPTPRVAKSKL